MRIELLEDDAILQDDGKPRHIIVAVEGRRMIIPTDKTIAELCLIINKAGVIPEKTLIVQPALNSQEKQGIIEPVSNPNEIQRNDYVKYIGKDDPDNMDLKSGAEYRVLDVRKNSYEIISDTAAFPLRLAVLKTDVVLARKSALKFVIPIKTFEQMEKCGFCKEDNALQLDEANNKYKGICVGCGKPIEIERKIAI